MRILFSTILFLYFFADCFAQVAGSRYSDIGGSIVINIGTEEPAPVCSCDDLDFSGITKGRNYRRLVGTQWQVYSWQLNRARDYITTTIGGTVTSEESAFYLDAGYTNLILPVSRFAPAANPLTLASSQHYINYNTASYLNVTTEPVVHYRHRIDFSLNVNGEDCSFRLEHEYEYTVAGATTAWQFDEMDYTCSVITGASARQETFFRNIANLRGKTKLEKEEESLIESTLIAAGFEKKGDEYKRKNQRAMYTDRFWTFNNGENLLLETPDYGQSIEATTILKAIGFVE